MINQYRIDITISHETAIIREPRCVKAPPCAIGVAQLGSDDNLIFLKIVI